MGLSSFFSHKNLSVKMNLESPYIFDVSCKKSHFVHKVTCTVHIDCGNQHVLGWNSALHHGPVLNHPLVVTM